MFSCAAARSASRGVTRRLCHSGRIRLGEYLGIAASVARGEARPAFRRAFEAQLAVFTAASRA
ncbi:hypothetical protein TSA1_22860 [Bradyrhizobium nitroreducens]|uniref:Uncharacterized protein n=1 Tax=Bradyrhizobium nitroreducens TaxID=709803 RepID=A0A2M6UF91_9BRAD|nr:hypothetical protein TSA1_22860 [Bradyrhizobium nitroreducens]